MCNKEFKVKLTCLIFKCMMNEILLELSPSWEEWVQLAFKKSLVG